MNFPQSVLNKNANIHLTNASAKCYKMLFLFHCDFWLNWEKKKKVRITTLTQRVWDFLTIFYCLYSFLEEQHNGLRDYYTFRSKWLFWAVTLRFSDEYWQEIFELDVLTKKKKKSQNYNWHSSTLNNGQIVSLVISRAPQLRCGYLGTEIQCHSRANENHQLWMQSTRLIHSLHQCNSFQLTVTVLTGHKFKTYKQQMI